MSTEPTFEAEVGGHLARLDEQRQRIGIPIAAIAADRAEELLGGAASLRADVKYDDGFFYLHQEQLDALHALLTLVHYDDLAESWLKMLPVELRPQRGGDR